MTHGLNILGTYVRTGSSPTNLSNCPGFLFGFSAGAFNSFLTNKCFEFGNTNKVPWETNRFNSSKSTSTPSGISPSFTLFGSACPSIAVIANRAVSSSSCISAQSLAVS
ncbi:unnamed protein product [Ectocarpus sp. CCAP 1310/34]|nr:unnamed protein product [Ectocarpus sp. CCAP 1310/34]